MICLECSKEAEQTETYKGIPIGTCEDGHRTGSILEEPKKIAFAA